MGVVSGCLNLSLPGDLNGTFSAPFFRPNKVLAILNSVVNLPRVAFAGLNRFRISVSNLKSSDRDGRLGEESTDVGDRAKIRGGKRR